MDSEEIWNITKKGIEAIHRYDSDRIEEALSILAKLASHLGIEEDVFECIRDAVLALEEAQEFLAEEPWGYEEDE